MAKDASSLFQFHKGTIRTCFVWISHNTLGNFNSIKVRLELVKDSVVKSETSNFNSIKVRLEPGVEQQDECWHPHFNSIKVRLELIPADGRIGSATFQFHKGTIRTFAVE